MRNKKFTEGFNQNSPLDVGWVGCFSFFLMFLRQAVSGYSKLVRNLGSALTGKISVCYFVYLQKKKR
jgi:hypothetical protein